MGCRVRTGFNLRDERCAASRVQLISDAGCVELVPSVGVVCRAVRTDNSREDETAWIRNSTWDLTGPIEGVIALVRPDINGPFTLQLLQKMSKCRVQSWRVQYCKIKLIGGMVQLFEFCKPHVERAIGGWNPHACVVHRVCVADSESKAICMRVFQYFSITLCTVDANSISYSVHVSRFKSGKCIQK